jgi:hypothetical protein
MMMFRNRWMGNRKATRSSIDFTAAMPGSSWYRRATARAERTLGDLAGTPVFETGLDLTQLTNQTRVANKRCGWGAAYGAATLKAENSQVFRSSKASINHPAGTVCARNGVTTKCFVQRGIDQATISV